MGQRTAGLESAPRGSVPQDKSSRNVRNLRTHRPQIRRELPAMVHGMTDSHTQVGNRWVFQDADEINRCGKVFAGQCFEAGNALGEVLIIPPSNVIAGL
jgi:hypothetical protein